VSARGDAPHVIPVWILPAILACLFAFQIYAFHWGVVTPDTVFQWGQALSGEYDDWHPPATTWLWRQLMRFVSGTAPVLVFDVLLYWIGVWLIADSLRRRAMPRAALCVILCAALPIPFGQMGAILKDPLLAACCLVSAGLLLASEKWPPSGRRLAFIVTLAILLFASATRVNAVFATAPLLAAWIPHWATQRPWKIAVALLASTMILGIAGWAIDNVALHPRHSRPIYSLVNFDLAGIIAEGGANAYPNLDAATARRLTALCYDPAQYNPTYLDGCDAVEDGLVRHAVERGQSAVAILWHGIAISPGAYLKHRLAHLNRNWRFLVQNVPNDAVYVMTTKNVYGIDFKENAATRIIARAAQIMAISPLGRPATWIAVALGVLLVGPGLRSRRFIMGVAGSVIFYGSAYALVSVAPDLRYNFWTILGSMMALVVLCAELGSGAAIPAGRLWAASIPAIATVIAEFGALFAN
jgi:hypothetical protein